jgi:16S rRNA (cytidine1402-2'-O)-methyltransferase
VAGTLYIIPTPVGNLADITMRAVTMLKQVELVLAEDTRTSSFLLKHLGIEKPLRAYHQHNEHKILEEVMGLLGSGAELALVSDAGTPGISDPGFLLIREAVRRGINVITLPGATAFVPALVNSGLPCNEFTYFGFLPQKKGRRTKLAALAAEMRTFVLYESPFRLEKLLGELAETLGPDRQASVSREISKMYEETRRGTLAELITSFKEKPAKGEIVVVVAGSAGEKTDHPEDE